MMIVLPWYKHEKSSATVLISYPFSVCLRFIPCNLMEFWEELLPSRFYHILVLGRDILSKWVIVM